MKSVWSDLAAEYESARLTELEHYLHYYLQ